MAPLPQDEASSIIQRAFRCFCARNAYFEAVGLREAALTLQAVWRCHLSRSIFRDALEANSEKFKISNAVPAPAVSKDSCRSLTQEHCAAIMIQQAVRCHAARLTYYMLLGIEATFGNLSPPESVREPKGASAVEHVALPALPTNAELIGKAEAAKDSAAIAIQSNFRCFRARNLYYELLGSPPENNSPKGLNMPVAEALPSRAFGPTAADNGRDSNAFKLDLRPHVVVQVASDSFQRPSKEPEAKVLRQMGGNPPDRPGSVQHAVREEALQPKIAEHLQIEAVDPNVDLAACMIQRSFRCFVARSIYYEKLGSGGKDSGNFSGDFELSSEVMGPEHNTNALQADHDYSAQEHYVQAAALLPVVEPKTENVVQKLSEEERLKQERDIKEEEEAQKAIQEYKERQDAFKKRVQAEQEQKKDAAEKDAAEKAAAAAKAAAEAKAATEAKAKAEAEAKAAAEEAAAEEAAADANAAAEARAAAAEKEEGAVGNKKAEGDGFTGTAEIVPKNPRGDVAEEESDMSTRVMSGLSLSRIPTSKPYLSIEDAEAAIILHEKTLAMTARNSASDLVSLGSPFEQPGAADKLSQERSGEHAGDSSLDDIGRTPSFDVNRSPSAWDRAMQSEMAAAFAEDISEITSQFENNDLGGVVSSELPLSKAETSSETQDGIIGDLLKEGAQLELLGQEQEEAERLSLFVQRPASPIACSLHDRPAEQLQTEEVTNVHVGSSFTRIPTSKAYLSIEDAEAAIILHETTLAMTARNSASDLVSLGSPFEQPGAADKLSQERSGEHAGDSSLDDIGRTPSFDVNRSPSAWDRAMQSEMAAAFAEDISEITSQFENKDLGGVVSSELPLSKAETSSETQDGIIGDLLKEGAQLELLGQEQEEAERLSLFVQRPASPIACSLHDRPAEQLQTEEVTNVHVGSSFTRIPTSKAYLSIEDAEAAIILHETTLAMTARNSASDLVSLGSPFEQPGAADKLSQERSGEHAGDSSLDDIGRTPSFDVNRSPSAWDRAMQSEMAAAFAEDISEITSQFENNDLGGVVSSELPLSKAETSSETQDGIIGDLLKEGAQLELLGQEQEEAERLSLFVQRPASPIACSLHDRPAEQLQTEEVTNVHVGSSFTRIPTSKAYLSIEDAEAAIILHEKTLAMTARNSASDLVSLGSPFEQPGAADKLSQERSGEHAGDSSLDDIGRTPSFDVNRSPSAWDRAMQSEMAAAFAEDISEITSQFENNDLGGVVSSELPLSKAETSSETQDGIIGDLLKEGAQLELLGQEQEEAERLSLFVQRPASPIACSLHDRPAEQLQTEEVTNVHVGSSFTRIPTSKPYLSIEDAEAAIILHEKTLAMTARNSASDLVSLGSPFEQPGAADKLSQERSGEHAGDSSLDDIGRTPSFDVNRSPSAWDRAMQSEMAAAFSGENEEVSEALVWNTTNSSHHPKIAAHADVEESVLQSTCPMVSNTCEPVGTDIIRPWTLAQPIFWEKRKYVEEAKYTTGGPQFESKRLFTPQRTRVIEDKPVVAVVRQLLDDAEIVFVRGSADSMDSGDTCKPLAESLSELIDSARTLFDLLSVEHWLSLQHILADCSEALPSLIRVLAVQAIQCTFRSHLAKAATQRRRGEDGRMLTDALLNPIAELIAEAQELSKHLPQELREPIYTALASNSDLIRMLRHVCALSIQCAWRSHMSKKVYISHVKNGLCNTRGGHCSLPSTPTRGGHFSQPSSPGMISSPGRGDKGQESRKLAPTSVEEIRHESRELFERVQADLRDLFREGAQLMELLRQEDAEHVSLLVQRPASSIARALYDRLAEHAPAGIVDNGGEGGDVHVEDGVIGDLFEEGGRLMELLGQEVTESASLLVQRPASPHSRARYDRLPEHAPADIVDNGGEGVDAHVTEGVIGDLLKEGAQLIELLGQEDAELVSLLVQRPASSIARALHDRLAEHAPAGIDNGNYLEEVQDAETFTEIPTLHSKSQLNDLNSQSSFESKSPQCIRPDPTEFEPRVSEEAEVSTLDPADEFDDSHNYLEGIQDAETFTEIPESQAKSQHNDLNSQSPFDVKSPRCIRPDPTEFEPGVSEEADMSTEGWTQLSNEDKLRFSSDPEKQSGERVLVKKTLAEKGGKRIRVAVSTSHLAESRHERKGLTPGLHCSPPPLSPKSPISDVFRRMRPSDGFAMIEYENGDIYEGNVKRGTRHGAGVYKYAIGDKYDGEWVAGQKHGLGTYTWPMGELYSGLWARSKQNGKGEFKWPNGGRYEGEWGERVPGNPFPIVRPLKVDATQNVIAGTRPGSLQKVSNDIWRAKEERIYRSGKEKKVTELAWPQPSRPATAMSAATTAEAISCTSTRPPTADGPLRLVTVDAWNIQIKDLIKKSEVSEMSGLRQKSGLSQLSKSSFSHKVLQDQPDLPARPSEGADDIFLQLASVMRRAGKMTEIPPPFRSTTIKHNIPWQFSSQDARESERNILRHCTSSPNRSAKVRDRLLADIYAGKAINNLVGFEPSFEAYEKRPRQPSPKKNREAWKKEAYGDGADALFLASKVKPNSNTVSCDFVVGRDTNLTLSNYSKPQESENAVPMKKKKKMTTDQEIYEAALFRTAELIKRLLEDHYHYAEQKKQQDYSASKKYSIQGSTTELKELFDKFCVVKGHSDLQTDGRQHTMDKTEWCECLIHLDILRNSWTDKIKDFIITKQEALELFFETKRKTTKNEDKHELNFKDFLVIIGKLENILAKKILALKRLSAKELLRRSVKTKDSKPINEKAAQASTREMREIRAHIRSNLSTPSHRSMVGGFGMGVALKKMSDNLHFENPFREPEDERWELRSCTPQNSCLSPQSSRISRPGLSFS